MCGRHVLEVDAKGLLRSYAAQPAKAFDWDAVFSIAPRAKAPVVREHVDNDAKLQRNLEFAGLGSFRGHQRAFLLAAHGQFSTAIDRHPARP